MRLFIPCLSPPGDQWSDVLGCFVSPRWYLKLLNTLELQRCKPLMMGFPPHPHQSICSVIFLHSGHIQGSTSTACIHSIQGSTSTEFPKVDVEHSIFGHPAIPFFTFSSKFIKSVRMMMVCAYPYSLVTHVIH